MLKNFLIIVLIVHVCALLIVNVLYFPNNKNNLPKETLNTVGNMIFNMKHDDNLSFYTPIKYYSNILGFDKPYEYFSPNVSKYDVDIVFFDQNNNPIKLYNSIEGDKKIFTFKYLFNAIQNNQNSSHLILESFCNRLFTDNPSVSRIYIYYIIKEPLVKPIKKLIYDVTKKE